MKNLLNSNSFDELFNKEEMAKTLKKEIVKQILELSKFSPQERVKMRIDKYAKMGAYTED